MTLFVIALIVAVVGCLAGIAAIGWRDTPALRTGCSWPAAHRIVRLERECELDPSPDEAEHVARCGVTRMPKPSMKPAPGSPPTPAFDRLFAQPPRLRWGPARDFDACVDVVMERDRTATRLVVTKELADELRHTMAECETIKEMIHTLESAGAGQDPKVAELRSALRDRSDRIRSIMP